MVPSHFALWTLQTTERRNPIDFSLHDERSRSTLLLYKTLLALYRLQFKVTRSKVKVNFGTLFVKHCEHYTDYGFCKITFKTSHSSCE